MSFGDTLENYILDVLVGNQAWVLPTLWLGLSTIDPGDDGSFLDEPPGAAGYVRLAAYPPSKWRASSLGIVVNDVDFVFPVATGDWGVITHFVLLDEDQGFSYLLAGALTIPLQVTTATRPTFLAGDLSVRLT